jgi:hypothetical protein
MVTSGVWELFPIPRRINLAEGFRIVACAKVVKIQVAPASPEKPILD